MEVLKNADDNKIRGILRNYSSRFGIDLIYSIEDINSKNESILEAAEQRYIEKMYKEGNSSFFEEIKMQYKKDQKCLIYYNPKDIINQYSSHFDIKEEIAYLKINQETLSKLKWKKESIEISNIIDISEENKIITPNNEIKTKEKHNQDTNKCLRVFSN